MLPTIISGAILSRQQYKSLIKLSVLTPFAGTAWDTVWMNENLCCCQEEPSQGRVFSAGTPTKLNPSQLFRNASNKDRDNQYCGPLLFSYWNRIPGSSSGHVAGRLAAYENQALPILEKLNTKAFRCFKLLTCTQMKDVPGWCSRNPSW